MSRSTYSLKSLNQLSWRLLSHTRWRHSKLWYHFPLLTIGQTVGYVRPKCSHNCMAGTYTTMLALNPCCRLQWCYYNYCTVVLERKSAQLHWCCWKAYGSSWTMITVFLLETATSTVNKRYRPFIAGSTWLLVYSPEDRLTCERVCRDRWLLTCERVCRCWTPILGPEKHW